MTDHIRFSEHDRILIDGDPHRVIRQSQDGIVLEPLMRPGASTSYRHNQIADFLEAPNFRVERGYFSPDRAQMQLYAKVDRLSDLPGDIRSDVLWKQAYCDAFLALERGGLVKRTETSVSERIEALERDVNLIDAGCQSIGQTSRAGTKRFVRKAPCPCSLLSWVRRYESAGFSPLALVPKTFQKGNRSDRFDSATEELLSICVDRYADPKRLTRIAVSNDTIARFREENLRRVERGDEPLIVPSKRTIIRRINALDPFNVYLKRHGADAANRKFALFELGVEALHPMERVEIDEWQVDL